MNFGKMNGNIGGFLEKKYEILFFVTWMSKILILKFIELNNLKKNTDNIQKIFKILKNKTDFNNSVLYKLYQKTSKFTL